MNINTLRNSVKHLKSIPFSHGKEYSFRQNIKSFLPRTNFQLIGEEFCINNFEGVGKCDLWLANCKNNFLLSLEIKVGNFDDREKQKYLIFQVEKYKKLMKVYYPYYTIYGIGAYKHEKGILYFNDDCEYEKKTYYCHPYFYTRNTGKRNVIEINMLKNVIDMC